MDAFIRYWIGDCVGVLAPMLILWMLLDAQDELSQSDGHRTRRIAGLSARRRDRTWVAFGFGAAADFNNFYKALPAGDVGRRQGKAWPGGDQHVPVQLGIIASVQLLKVSAITVLEIQALAAVPAMFGFFIGIVVDEKQRVSRNYAKHCAWRQQARWRARWRMSSTSR